MTQFTKHRKLSVSWVLVNELAVGPAPTSSQHIEDLKHQGLRSILSLCSEEEAPPPDDLQINFIHKRIVLPDHRTGRLPQLEELKQALVVLSELIDQHGPVYVHCVAAVERSPLLCMGWMVHRHKLNPNTALEYLMQVHPRTNPLPGQLALLSHPNFIL